MKFSGTFGPSSLIGIEINFVQGNSTINVVELHKLKGEFKVISKYVGPSSIEILRLHIPKDALIAISLNGPMVLHKKLQISDTDGPSSILSQFLPNPKTADFLIQKHATIDKSHLVSVTRIQLVEQILMDFQSISKNILRFSLGPHSIQTLFASDVLNDDMIELKLPEFTIFFAQKTIIDFSKTKAEIFNYSLGADSIESNYLLALSSALSLTNLDLEFPDEYPPINQNRKSFVEKRTTNRNLAIGLCSLFVLLLINFIYNMNLLASKRELENRMLISEGETIKIRKQEEALSNLNLLNENSGILLGLPSSYYLDKIGQTVPNDIVLKSISLQPESKSFNAQDTLSFNTNLIDVVGTCRNAEDLNSWIGNLKKMQWIHEISVNDLSMDNELDTHVFYLIISIKSNG